MSAMEREIAGHPVHMYSGGRPFDAGAPVAVLVHGAGHDHSVWNHQARSLAHHGFSVLAPDLPGHGRSGGVALDSIEALADWLACLLADLDVADAALVGHSMGSLIALHTASRHPDRVGRLILVGSVAPMPVAAALLEAAQNDRPVAHAMINQWSYSPTHRLGRSPSPGMVLTGLNQRLMERQREGVLATDLAACDAYAGGLTAAASVRTPVAMICGGRDQMTPLRATQALRQALANAAGGPRMIMLDDSGHAMMAEAPEALTDAIRSFLLQR
ncbi:alpha/beta fold hydrolase [Rhodocyclaceae bacterium SMB388]